mmetsp:Transcript_36725/g.88527  ORF Transcript_36725/g.88527 Transcript_36725/m.88527 type:complete len:126 (-) Transcript_36725:696-1073(-)
MVAMAAAESVVGVRANRPGTPGMVGTSESVAEALAKCPGTRDTSPSVMMSAVEAPANCPGTRRISPTAAVEIMVEALATPPPAALSNCGDSSHPGTCYVDSTEIVGPVNELRRAKAELRVEEAWA